MIAGVLGSCIGLLLLLPFGPGASLWFYAAAFIFLQFWWNWVAGAYAGLIPDVMVEHEQGRASAWLNILSVAGTVAGILRRSHCIRDSIRDWSALAHALGGSRHPRAGDGPCRK